jgi:hypothetical protein
VSVLGHSQEHLVSIWKRNQKQKQRKTEGKIIKEQKAFKSGKKTTAQSLTTLYIKMLVSGARKGDPHDNSRL